jgi:hypothetical protein
MEPRNPGTAFVITVPVANDLALAEAGEVEAHEVRPGEVPAHG